MNRRGFLKGILAFGVAPYVVTAAGVLMPVRALSMPAWVGIDLAAAPDVAGSYLIPPEMAGSFIRITHEIIMASEIDPRKWMRYNPLV